MKTHVVSFDHQGISQDSLVPFQTQAAEQLRQALGSARRSAKGAAELSWPRLVCGTWLHAHGDTNTRG